ncbi:MAG: carboxypeptidase-like regulatory domain-containing protein [Planctomycetaceae bacterium]|nr:carboxypeptidase-like regulatory domain-containing protein [Planctomycetaceae bacterium]
MNRYFLSLTIALAISVFHGCGDKSRPVDLPKLHQAKIVSTQDGTPLVGARVEIYCTDTSAKYRVSGGITDESGVVALRTYGFNGAPVGKYKVTALNIIKGELPPGTKLSRFNQPDKLNLVDKKYSTEQLSDQEIEIVAGRNEFKIDFGAPVRYVHEAGVRSSPNKRP